MPLLKKARSTNTPRFLDYLVTWQSEFARVPPRAPEPLNTGTLGTRLTSYRPLNEKFENVFSELDTMLTNFPSEDEKGKKQLLRLKKKLDQYLREMPAIGFNSSPYDINVIRKFLFREIECVELDEENDTSDFDFVIKRNNAYMCLKTASLKFLDICNYLAPGYSYAQFLQAYECVARKGYFPYEWFDNREKLDVGELPPQAAFFSTLRNTNISDEEYQYCLDVWQSENMQTFRDYLVWYNNLDAEPFVEAIEKMFQFYQPRGLDLFKDGISVPGLVMKYLFSRLEANTFFSLFQVRDKDLYYSFKSNIVGGPSIIFQRYHERDKTFIRGGKPCKRVWGADANSLYLWALAQDMPCGYYARRSSETNFRKQDFFNKSSIEWLDYVAQRDGVNIEHAHNMGEKRIGRYFVDGFDTANKTIYEFNGCYFHGHQCEINEKDYNERCGVPMRVLYERTIERKIFARPRLHRSGHLGMSV